MIRSELLQDMAGIIHGFGVRGVTIDSYLKGQGLGSCVRFCTNQIHGNRVHLLSQDNDSGTLQGDAFITDQPGIVCHVRSADCVPIIIADARRCAVAAVHAGWRGTACDVVGAALKAMNRTFDTNPGDCVAAIGPRICGECYEVGDEVIAGIEEQRIGRGWLLDGKRIDLGAANASLLMRAGLKKENIDVLPHCTRCDEKFASYRRDRSETERQVNFIVISAV